MKITFNVQSMTDNGENVNIQLQEVTAGSENLSGGIYRVSHTMTLNLKKEDATDYFPGKKFNVTVTPA